MIITNKRSDDPSLDKAKEVRDRLLSLGTKIVPEFVTKYVPPFETFAYLNKDESKKFDLTTFPSDTKELYKFKMPEYDTEKLPMQEYIICRIMDSAYYIDSVDTLFHNTLNIVEENKDYLTKYREEGLTLISYISTNLDSLLNSIVYRQRYTYFGNYRDSKLTFKNSDIVPVVSENGEHYNYLPTWSRDRISIRNELTTIYLELLTKLSMIKGFLKSNESKVTVRMFTFENKSVGNVVSKVNYKISRKYYRYTTTEYNNLVEIIVGYTKKYGNMREDINKYLFKINAINDILKRYKDYVY